MTDRDAESPTGHTPSASSQEDLRYVRQALSGDQSAYAFLMNKYQQPLYFHVVRMVYVRDMVDDLLQEVFTKAFDNLHTYNSAYAFSTWLYRIATNHSIDHLRKRRLRTMSLDEPIQTKDGEVRIEVADDSEQTDAEVLHRQRALILKDAVEALPPRFRRVIELRHMEDKSYHEIAELLDLPLGTVKAHIFRAREALFKALKDREGSF
jgi:RNA polymerase sigma factor (sigma-70 family)